MATSAPEIVKISNNNTASRIISKVIPCVIGCQENKRQFIEQRIADRMTLQGKDILVKG